MARTRDPAPDRARRIAAVVALLLGASFVAASPAAPTSRVGAAPAPRPLCPGVGDGLARPEPEPVATDGVSGLRYVFVDRSRPARPDDPADASDTGEDGLARTDGTCRVLRVAVRYPTGTAGPLPLVLVVHGRDGDPTALEALLDRWVRSGYVVVAPYFLRTEKGADGTPTGAATRRQAADARFVLDRVLALDDDPSSALHGLVDPDHIGAAGMSLGGMTVYGLVANTCCRDDRITAALLLAAVHRPFPGGRYVRQRIPIMLVQGNADDGYHNSVSAYPELGAPKWFVTLHGSTHSPPFEIPRGPEGPLVDDMTTAFWNRYLHSHHRVSALAIVDTVHAAGDRASLLHQARGES